MCLSCDKNIPLVNPTPIIFDATIAKRPHLHTKKEVDIVKTVEEEMLMVDVG